MPFKDEVKLLNVKFEALIAKNFYRGTAAIEDNGQNES